MSDALKRDLRKLCNKQLVMLKISYGNRGWHDKVKLIDQELKRREEDAKDFTR